MDRIIQKEGMGDLKYMREDLKREYKRYHDRYPDLNELHPPLMNISDILRAYFILADYFSDPTADVEVEKMLIGVRDMNLLVSALGRQNISFGGKVKYSHPLDICATLFFGLVKNHAFSDGNKRTALLTLLYQLEAYGYCPCAGQKEYEKLVVAIASNELSVRYPNIWKFAPKKQQENDTDRSVYVISTLLRKMTKRKDNSFHIDIPARDFMQAINAIDGCSCQVEGDKIKLQRVVSKKLWKFHRRNVVKTYAIPYRGDTRPIKAGTAREALERLDLYEEFAGYKSFVEKADPRYMLIEQFEAPLRRLKDQ